jgi:hypothetical protein
MEARAEAWPVIPKNHIRAYRWCKPDKIGVLTMVPDRWTARRSGASFQPQVRARLVVILRIQSQDPSQMPFAEDHDMTRQSRRSVPISRSTYGFCQGDLGEIGRSRIPIARTRLVKACP